jgi:2-(1,2-epoxy-1,2-dihydrophenyl)acetyl-CoA isomerase
MKDTDILVERIDRVCHLRFNRPDRLNALTGYHLRRIMRELLKVWRDESIGSVLFSGIGRAFTAGHDLTGSDLGATGAGIWNELFDLLNEIPKPTVAAINGVAVGGGLHLALACDLALCRDGATIGESFVWIGACPDTGGHIYLQRSIGHMRAAAMMMLGLKLDAKNLANEGLFISSWPSEEELMAEAMKVATHLANGPRRSYEVIRNGLEFARLNSTTLVRQWEADREEEMTETYDMREGVAAFLEKREPEFRGH